MISETQKSLILSLDTKYSNLGKKEKAIHRPDPCHLINSFQLLSNVLCGLELLNDMSPVVPVPAHLGQQDKSITFRLRLGLCQTCNL